MPGREYNFDGLVGPTHNHGGLSRGNVASTSHGGDLSNPREAALQGLEKMATVARMGVGQAVLPPHFRPQLAVLRQLGFDGSDEAVLAQAARDSEHLLRLCSSASAMWTANAATVAPSSDTADGRVHLSTANLQTLFHRAIEADTTFAILRAIFADPTRFCVHPPLPGGEPFSDEGAANHLRLTGTGERAVHLFAWGRSAFEAHPFPRRYPARQSLEASRALARRHRLSAAACLFPQQSPEGIDAGAFHTDVLAVGNESFFMLHEKAFVDTDGLLEALRGTLGNTFQSVVATAAELSLSDAIDAYPFNSQILSLPNGQMTLLAPAESRDNSSARRFLERVLEEDNPLTAVHYLDLKQSMRNGGGPACLRLRIVLTDDERQAIAPNIFFTPLLHNELSAWIGKHYRDRLSPEDLADPLLARESMTALDALTQILRLGSIYDFQQAGPYKNR